MVSLRHRCKRVVTVAPILAVSCSPFAHAFFEFLPHFSVFDDDDGDNMCIAFHSLRGSAAAVAAAPDERQTGFWG